MEGEEEALSGLLLDSVMLKATELEAGLRAWKDRLRQRNRISPPAGGGVGREEERGGGVGGGGGGGERGRRKGGDEKVGEEGRERGEGRGGGGRGGGGGEDQIPLKEEGSSSESLVAWQQLTKYIIELEKQLHQLREGGESGGRGGGGERGGRGGGRGGGGGREGVGGGGVRCVVGGGRGGGVGGRGGGSELSPVLEVTQLTQEGNISQTFLEERGEAERLVDSDRQYKALFLVFSRLTTTELCSAAAVCRGWRLLSHHPLLWTRVLLREILLSSENLQTLSQWCKDTLSITLHGLMPGMAGKNEDLHAFIARQKGSLEPGLSSLLLATPLLTSLSVTECNLMVTERLFWLCSVHCPCLLHLTYSSDEFPPTPQALWSLTNGCSKLQSLHLPPCPGSPNAEVFNDDCLLSIAMGWPHLLSLTVGGPGITESGLSEFVRFCPWLQELTLVNGPELKSSTVSTMLQAGGLTALHTLTLTFTPISPKALYLLTTSLPALISVHLHVSLHTYFSGTPTHATVTKYHRILDNLEDLQRRPQLHGVIHLYQHTSNTGTIL